ncbi:MAG TPA: trypsin-like peptidase domain-containing protein [Usitatibacter sp.]|nr:trypsin-like peptidase domain-containing protein [Usitatibacter sp.]
MNAHGGAPLSGAFGPHSPSLPVAFTLGANKKFEAPENPGFVAIVGMGRADEVAARPMSERLFQWRPVAGGYVAELSIRSPDAAALRVALEFKTRAPVEVRVGSQAAWAGDSPATVLGADLVAALREGHDGPFWTPVTSGDTQFIQLTALGSIPPGSVRVVNLSHLWMDPSRPDMPQTQRKYLSACQANYSCATDPTILDKGKAVARVLHDLGNGTASVCTGSLLNDYGSTGTAWFTTAAHCLINTQAVASSIQFFWFYDTACNGSGTVPAATTTVGAELLLWDADIDFNFLKITGPLPSGVVRLGWTTDEISAGTGLFSVHHPSGHTASYSTGSKVQDQTVAFSEKDLVFDINTTVVRWAVGLTEPGSSGSPLMTTDGKFLGTLSAGPLNQACDVPTSFFSYYAKFSSAYPRIRDLIDPGLPADIRPDRPIDVHDVLDANGSYAGTLNSAGDQDWFKFNIPGPGTFLVWVSLPPGSTADPFGRLYAADAVTLLDSSELDPNGLIFHTNFMLAHRMTAGSTPYVLVTTQPGGSLGRYILNTLFYPDDDHNGYPAFGSPMPANGAATGTISPPGDADAFVINISRPGNLTLESSGSTPLLGRLRDAAFDLIAHGDGTSSNPNFRIQKAVTPGTYYLRVLGLDPVASGPYTIKSTFTPTGAPETAKSLAFRGTVSPATPMYGGFELAGSATVYVLGRGNSLGTLGVTQSFLDAPRVRLYDAQGHDIISDPDGPGFNGCVTTNPSAAPVAAYYQNTRAQPAHARDSCTAQALAAGAYTFSVTPAASSSPNQGEVLFEVLLGGGSSSGAILKSLGARGTVTSTATMYGGFETLQPMTVYILVRGNSLGTLGVTQNFLDGPRVRVFDARGVDLMSDGSAIPGFRFCVPGGALSTDVRTYYEVIRGQGPDPRDTCAKQALAAGAYTFSVTPEPGTTSSGEVLFEVILAP